MTRMLHLRMKLHTTKVCNESMNTGFATTGIGGYRKKVSELER
jgi:hypothetical protein